MNMSECQNSVGFCDIFMLEILGYILQSQSPRADSRGLHSWWAVFLCFNTIFLIILNINITIKYSDVLKVIYYFLLNVECYNK